MGSASANWVVQGDELRAIGEDGFDLHLVHELGHAVHHLVLTQPGGALLHQLRHVLAVTRTFKHQKTEPGHRFGVVELEAAVQSSFRKQCRGHDQEFVLFLGTEMHRKTKPMKRKLFIPNKY